MSKHLCILVSPDGEESYDAYGPMTKLRDRATRFASAQVAIGAANQRYGRSGTAFWNSERASQDKAMAEHRGWTMRTEEVADDDVRRTGHFVVDYPIGGDGVGDRLYAHGDPTVATTWSPDLEGCHLWDANEGALTAIRAMPVREGRRYAISTY